MYPEVEVPAAADVSGAADKGGKRARGEEEGERSGDSVREHMEAEGKSQDRCVRMKHVEWVMP